MHGTWTEISIAGKSADAFEPAGDLPRFALLFLHPIGLETLRESAAFTESLSKHRLACVCPRAGRSWWVDRACSEFDPTLTPEKHLMTNVVPWMTERWKLKPRRIGVFGISMGGQGALRLAFRHASTFPAVAGIASAIDFHELIGQGTSLDEMYDSKEQARQDTAVMQIQPYAAPPHIYFCIDPCDHPWHRGNDRLHEKLAALGIPHTMDLVTQAGGHSWIYFERMADVALAFLRAGLEQESRRLL